MGAVRSHTGLAPRASRATVAPESPLGHLLLIRFCDTWVLPKAGQGQPGLLFPQPECDSAHIRVLFSEMGMAAIKENVFIQWRLDGLLSRELMFV